MTPGYTPRNQCAAGFSMIEVALALGIIVFAMMALVALIPVGLQSNQISAEETRATNLLTALEADLRNTHPSASQGKSRWLGLTLPYVLDGNGGYVPNPAIQVGIDPPAYSYTAGLSDEEAVADLATRPRFQASVIYTAVPAANDLGGVEARLVVSWPGKAGGTVAQLAQPDETGGFVEVAVTFPRP
jgi:uncharacterized protein (TIGR02598 family)